MAIAFWPSSFSFYIVPFVLKKNYYLCVRKAQQMKDEAEIVVDRLNAHIKELVSKYEELKSQNNILGENLKQQVRRTETYKLKIEDLKNRFAELELKENDLKLKQDRLQLKDALVEVSGSREEAKKIIARIISEIDSCIYLLDE